MKKFSLFLCLTIQLFASCIQDEAPNAEADIISCTLAEGQLKRPAIIENDRISLVLDKESDLSKLAPIFELTPGATISPKSGTERNFLLPQTYIVTSEDKKWQKEYIITASYNKEIPTLYKVDGVKSKAQGKYHYHVITEIDEQQSEIMEWGSANSGYVTAAVLDRLPTDDPTVFPTYSTPGRNGNCAVMMTRKPKSDWVTKFAPIAAGNLFTGTFGSIEDTQKPGLSTHFGEGQVFQYYPLSIEGYYKYTPGTNLVVKYPQGDKDYSTYTDTWDIYAVLYDATQKFGRDGKAYLDGYNVLNDPSIVLLAHLSYEERQPADDWTHFYIPFRPFEGGTPFDAERLRNGDYNMAIVMSSSEEGAYFNGAENSTLYVDDVELKYTEDF